jgi:flagellar basal-body rod protein FlgB
MTTENIALFKAMGAKMHYLNERQRVISQNIANADTPGYESHDLTKVDFGAVLKNIADSNVLEPETTNPMHMPSPHDIGNPKDKEQKISYEIAPDGNAVIMEEQMVKQSQTAVDYNLMTSLYQKNINMIRTALGRGGQ